MKQFFLACSLVPIFIATTQCGNAPSSKKENNLATSTQANTNTSYSNKKENDFHPVYGALINVQKAPNASELKLKITNELGISYIRESLILSNLREKKLEQSHLKTIYTINLGAAVGKAQGGTPTPFTRDYDNYKKRLEEVIRKYKVYSLIVIENEETNKSYHSGSIDDYINQLKAAITVAHNHNLKIANGGITSRLMTVLVWDDYVSRGMKTQAEDYANRAFPPAMAKRLHNLVNNSELTQQLKDGKKLIAAYKTLDIDYVNFHWYEPIAARGKGGNKDAIPDMRALEETVNYLRRATGKEVITNEIGQLNDSPELVTKILQKLYDLKLPYVFWYSGDGGPGKAVALHNPDGSLRPNGIAFRDFIKAKGL